MPSIEPLVLNSGYLGSWGCWQGLGFRGLVCGPGFERPGLRGQRFRVCRGLGSQGVQDFRASGDDVVCLLCSPSFHSARRTEVPVRHVRGGRLRASVSARLRNTNRRKAELPFLL